MGEQRVEVSYHDPHVPTLTLPDGPVLSSTELTDDLLRWSDCLVVLTAQRAVDHARAAALAPLVFDTRNVVPADAGPHVNRL